jgi:hypothetical protein
LKNKKIELRTRDPEFLTASLEWLNEVSRVIAPPQVKHSGPILLVQPLGKRRGLGKWPLPRAILGHRSDANIQFGNRRKRLAIVRIHRLDAELAPS